MGEKGESKIRKGMNKGNKGRRDSHAALTLHVRSTTMSSRIALFLMIWPSTL